MSQEGEKDDENPYNDKNTPSNNNQPLSKIGSSSSKRRLIKEGELMR